MPRAIVASIALGHDHRDRTNDESGPWVSANAFTSLFKPRVLDVFEREHERHQRAELMTLMPGSPRSRTDVLRHVADLPDERCVNTDQALAGLLDWKSWGRGPVGTDAATLLSYSLVPQSAERVRDTFADVLATDAGLLAQFYVAARLPHRADKGDHPDLAAPLRKHSDSCDDITSSSGNHRWGGSYLIGMRRLRRGASGHT